jgi:hypothetical protein
MSPVIWIGLYCMGILLAVPLIARGVHESAGAHDEWFASPRFCAGYALAVSYAWPLFLAGWLLIRLVRLITPWIFSDERPAPAHTEEKGEGRASR